MDHLANTLHLRKYRIYPAPKKQRAPKGRPLKVSYGTLMVPTS